MWLKKILLSTGFRIDPKLSGRKTFSIQILISIFVLLNISYAINQKMGQYITIIYADEKLEIDDKIPHFYKNGHLIIPYNNEIRYAVEELQNICKEGMTLDELFNFYIDTDYILNEDKINFLKEYKGLSNDLEDLEDIALVEFLKLLNLPDFTVLSYDDLAGDYILNFENFIYKNSDREFYKLNIRMDEPYLYKYEGCKNHCLNEIEIRRHK